jgi:purine-binding chemotaxis protein CheW
MTRRDSDWEQICARLDQARGALEASGVRTGDAASQILRDRARALARPPDEAPESSDALTLLEFALGAERYAMEIAHVAEVLPMRDLTPVPCTPSFVLGVTNYRGQILPVLDFRRLLGASGQPGGEEGRIVVTDAGRMRFGILADSVSGVRQVAARAIAPPPAVLAGDRQVFLAGVTADLVAVLDVEKLVSGKRILVHEEVEG